MPVEPPRLDDLRFEGVREDLERRIPVHTPEWTDYNESDPGITLIQLFAHLAELTGYRLNRVPEKNHIELLKLLGVRLNPARAATSRIALLLADPATLRGFTLPAATRANATEGEPPPSFETDHEHDVAPAEPVVMLTTAQPELWNLGPLSKGENPPEDPMASEWLTLVWDGKKPKLAEMPLGPIALLPNPEQRHLWIGLDLNPSLNAGFRGVRVTLSVQLDDDEQPDLEARVRCEPIRSVGEAPSRVDWLDYFDTVAGAMRRVPGRIADRTDRLTRSGALTFTVPFALGPIPPEKFRNLRDAVEPPPQQGCEALALALQEQIEGLVSQDDETDPTGKIDLADLQNALTGAVSDIQARALQPIPAVPHPLDPKLRDPNKIKGWLRIELPVASPEAYASPRLRIVTFNAVPVTNATTVTSELLGAANGRPGQVFRLAHGNVLGTVDLALQEEPDRPLVPWTPVESLDASGPNDRHFALDPEAGIIETGDGIRGRIAPLVPDAGFFVARRYRHGGGRAGEVELGTITELEGARAGLAGCVNFVAARGGHDPEDLEAAKVRARKELSTRSRAVTAGDFAFIASQTPNVRVARTAIVPRRRPLSGDEPAPPVAATRCGDPLPAGPSGLRGDVVAHGAVTVVVVPDEKRPEPTPTLSFLRAVCEHLDRHRLVTTEVYVVPPQYLRLCRFDVAVRGTPGYTRSELQTLVERRLATYLHVLTGGADGKGFSFGGQVHIADLVSQVLRTEGVERVETLFCEYSRTKSNAAPRRQGRLTLCPEGPDDTDRIDLAPEETVSIDLEAFTLRTVT